MVERAEVCFPGRKTRHPFQKFRRRLLQAMPQTAAARLAKLLKSAIANAVENQGLHKEDLIVAQIFANEGPTRKWRRFGARGRFKPILRRSSHVTIVLRDAE